VGRDRTRSCIGPACIRIGRRVADSFDVKSGLSKGKSVQLVGSEWMQYYDGQISRDRCESRIGTMIGGETDVDLYEYSPHLQRSRN
jgi:hypothetical protein